MLLSVPLKYVVISGLFLSCLVLFRWNTITLPFERDEGEYAHAAQLLLDGGAPYKEAFMQKPPMIIYTYALTQSISRDVWAPRVLEIVFLFLAGLVLMSILLAEYGIETAFIALMLFAPMLGYPLFRWSGAHPEVFALLPFILAWWFYFKALREKSTGGTFVIGALCAIAILYKPIVLPAALFLSACVIVHEYQEEGARKALRQAGIFIAGAVVSTFIIVLPIWMRGAGGAMIEAAVTFNRYYASLVGFDVHIFQTLGIIFLRFWAPLFVLGAWFLYRRPKHWVFFSGLFVACIIGTAGAGIFHYYLFAAPVLAVIAALALTDIARYVSVHRHISLRLVLSLLAALVLTAMLLPVGRQFTYSSEYMEQWIYPGQPFAESRLIADEVQKITTSTDRVFIAGSEPQILYYADRKSASRFVVTYPFIYDTPMARAYQREAISELTADPPTAIVVSRSVSSGLFDEHSPQQFVNYLRALLNTDYTLVGGVVWQDDTHFRFSTTLTAQDEPNTTLVLYKRK